MKTNKKNRYIKKDNLFERFKKSKEQYNLSYAKNIPTNLIIEKDLSAQATKLLTIMLTHIANKEDCCTSQSLLAFEMNRSIRSIQRYLKELAEKGFLKVIRRGMMKTNKYNFSSLLSKIKAIKEKNNIIFDTIKKINTKSKKNNNKPTKAKKSWFCGYEQREYDWNSLERKLLGWDNK